MIEEKDRKVIETALERICTSKQFVHSSINVRILRYLVEKAFIGEDLKEYTIGIDLFDEQYSTNKNDGAVRSYMYKLRRKLDEFYKTTATEEPIVFVLKTGQYNLSFISADAQRTLNKEPQTYIKLPVKYLKGAGFVSIVITVVFLLLNQFGNQQEACWQPFFGTGAENLVVVSDQYMLTEVNEWGETHAITYHNINNNREYLNYTKEHPERTLKTTDYTLMSQMVPWSVQTLTNWFSEAGSQFNLQFESKLNYEEVRDNNILFIGQYKTMSVSKSLFLKDSKVFTTYGDGFRYKNDKIYNTTHTENGKIEYALVSFTSFKSEKVALYFVSNNDIGVMATLRNFTDKEWLEKFYDTLPEGAKYFNALYEVQGLQRTDMSCRLVEFEVLE